MTWDAQIELLKAQYKALKPRERDIRDEEAAEGRRRADSRIREVRQALADEFRRYREAGMPQYAIQDVIGTKDWNTLRQWRELMNVKSPREIRAALAAEHSPFQWTDNYATLTVTKLPNGDMLDEPVIYDMTTNRLIADRWWPDAVNGSVEKAVMLAMENPKPWKEALHEEIQSQIDAGNVTNPEGI